jgi:hypothetical protein
MSKYKNQIEGKDDNNWIKDVEENKNIYNFECLDLEELE